MLNCRYSRSSKGVPLPQTPIYSFHPNHNPPTYPSSQSLSRTQRENKSLPDEPNAKPHPYSSNVAMKKRKCSRILTPSFLPLCCSMHVKNNENHASETSCWDITHDTSHRRLIHIMAHPLLLARRLRPIPPIPTPPSSSSA